MTISDAALTWAGVTIDCRDPMILAAFWGELLDAEITEDADLPGWRRLVSRSGQPGICLQPVPEPKVGKVRIHLDLVAHDLAAAIERVVSLGGSRTGERHEYPGAGVVEVMADPEGNEFCLVQLDQPG